MLLAVIACAPGDAQYARLGLPQFTHDRWTSDDGVPPTGIGEIAQTPDGWLWMTSSEGLHRFDGVTFERIDPPPGSPMEGSSPASLLVSRSGELWIGYRQNGGVAVYRNGRLQAVPMSRRPSWIDLAAQTADGAIWATGEGYRDTRLHRWIGGRWEAMDARLGLPDGFAGALCVTEDGTMWLSLRGDSNEKTFFLKRPPGAARFRPSPLKSYGMISCKVDRQGRMWIADKGGTRLAVMADGKEVERPIAFPALPKLDAAHIAFDGAGGLWGGTNSVGIYYIPEAGKPARKPTDRLERFGAADGLTADGVGAPFVDREGSIWFGSEAGLNRFRPASAVRELNVPGDPGQGYAMAGSGDQVLIMTTDGVFQLTRGRPRRLLDHGVAGLCPDGGGGFWGVRDHEILHVRGGRRRALPLPEGVGLTGHCAVDRLGRLWVTLYEGGAMWHDATGWHRPAKPLPNVLWPDLVLTSAGEVAYVAEDELVRLGPGGAVRIRLASHGIGAIIKVAAGSRDIFISGNNGLLRVRGRRVSRIDARRYPWVARLRGLVQIPSGETWLRSALWVSRVSTADLDRAFEDPRAPLHRSFYDLRDGVTPALDQTFTGPQVSFGDDGRIWLPDREGLSYIDPAKLASNRVPPPVVIRSVASGNKVFRDPGTLTLPAGTRALDIGYAALSYVAPHRIQFRYRLEGVDDNWVFPGSRRLASYANLGPGTYRFQVAAANGDGVWNSQGATLAFEIPPTFLESWPFKLICALGALVLAWLAYSMRLRTVTNRIRGRMAERVAERERIARELHDTLLQSVQALTLRFQLVVDDLSIKGPPRLALEAAIGRADEVIAEGRDRVLELRSPQESDLQQMIADLVRQQAFDPAVSVSIESAGTPRRLDPPVLDEVVRIAGEAIFNIRRHAKASRVAIEIRYHSSFSICFTDNGLGIDPAIALKGGKDGHFGLAGMRERARRLKGQLVVCPLPEGGTQVMLKIPGRIAYRRRLGWPFRRGAAR